MEWLGLAITPLCLAGFGALAGAEISALGLIARPLPLLF